MSDRIRKQGSQWDMKEDIQQLSELGENNAWTRKERHSGLHDDLSPKCSDLDMNNASKNSQDCSGWSSLEPLPGNNGVNKDDNISRDRQKISGTTRAWDGDNSYYKSMSPAFDESAQQTKSRSPRRGRDRSRGRIRGRSRSGGRGGSKSRSRSRGKPRHWRGSQSRSPVCDNRRESYGLGDKRRSGSGMSSQPCRDFAVGNCRRGSQCWFLHQNNPNYRDRGHRENNPVERWRSRLEHGDSLKDSNARGLRDCPRDKVLDGYGDGYGHGEPLKHNGKAKICCRDFLKGTCRWGASCRFSHDDASNDNHARGNRSASFDHDRPHQANKGGKIPCKYFVMGKCHRDDCRFSHDDPKSGNPELRLSDDRWGHNSDNKNISWNGLTWEEATCVSGVAKSTGWDDSLAAEKTFSDPLTAEKLTDGEWGHASQKESRTWNGPKQLDKSAEGNGGQECGNKGAGMGSIEFMEKLVRKEELQLNFKVPRSQTWDKHIHETNSTHQLFNAATQPKVSETSFFQQLPGGDISKANCHNALPDVQRSANTIPPVSVPVQGSNEKFDSTGSQPLLSSSGSSQSHDILSGYPCNGQSIDLNGTVQLIFSPLGLQKKMEINHEETVKTHDSMELEVPLVSSEVSQNVVTDDKFIQIASLPASERFGNGQHLPPLDAGLGGLNSTLLMPCPSSASLISPCDPIILECNPAQPSKPSNSSQTTGFLPSSCEQKNHMPLEQLFLPSLVNYTSSNIQQHDGLKEECHTSPKLKQKEPVTDVESCKQKYMIAEKCKQKEENIHSETVEAEQRVEEGMNSKDEKGMRLFKIALVEFVKEILKPTWKEGKMSREVHKTIVKKVVDKVTSTIQGDHVPKTQDKIDQYLSFSKPKISKLVQAYMERFLKN